jgi:hypothetical protein
MDCIGNIGAGGHLINLRAASALSHTFGEIGVGNLGTVHPKSVQVDPMLRFFIILCLGIVLCSAHEKFTRWDTD